jgi:hypothetical protein
MLPVEDPRVAVNSLRHVPVIGGVAAWPIPFVTTILGLGALGIGHLELAVAVGVLGVVAQMFLRSVVGGDLSGRADARVGS